ncbi:MAG: alpha/beta hydrolase [Pseudomonadota bacterium]
MKILLKIDTFGSRIKMRSFSLGLILGIFVNLFGLFIIPGVADAKGFEPMAEALMAMKSSESVRVERIPMPKWGVASSYFLFSPEKVVPKKGFLFYPGAQVDTRSYAPLMREIALAGFKVALINMPFGISTLGAYRASDVMRQIGSVKTWIIGGHSLGGVSAGSFSEWRESQVGGLVLWAAYTSKWVDLSSLEIPVLSIFGDQDGLSTVEDIEENKSYLPDHTSYVKIKGGNHTWFGSYGDGTPQDGDNPSTISRFEQQKRVVEETLHFLTRSH